MKCNFPYRNRSLFQELPANRIQFYKIWFSVRPISTSCTFFCHKHLPRTIHLLRCAHQLIFCPTLRKCSTIVKGSHQFHQPDPFRTTARYRSFVPSLNDFASLPLVPIQTPARYKINALYCIRSQHRSRWNKGSGSLGACIVFAWIGGWLWCPCNGLYVSGNVSGRGLGKTVRVRTTARISRAH